MTEISIETVRKMIANRNTSYKLFLMKYLALEISLSKTVFSFKKLACGMVSEAWEYYEQNFYRFTKNDRIFDLVEYSLGKSDEITIYTHKRQVFDFLWNNTDKYIIKMLKSLVAMVQFRLLVPFVDSKELSGLTWDAQNKRIRELSQSIDMFYTINSDFITINNDWVKFVSLEREIIIKTVEGIIADEYDKKSYNLRG